MIDQARVTLCKPLTTELNLITLPSVINNGW